MAIFFVLFRCRITGDELPEIIRHENWLCCWGKACDLALTMNEDAKRDNVEHDYYIAQFSRVE